MGLNMYGAEELKGRIELKGDAVVCPVVGCRTRVRKMTDETAVCEETGKSLDAHLGMPTTRSREYFGQFLCREHGIYITPSTFIYRDLRDSLVWYDDVDRGLIEGILSAKRMRAQPTTRIVKMLSPGTLSGSWTSTASCQCFWKN